MTLLLWRQSDVIARTQALRLLSAKSLAHRLRSGRWQSPHPGIYLGHNGPMTPEQRYWVGCLAAGVGALLAGPTAAALGGLRGYPTPTVHVLVPAARRIRQPPENVVVHRTSRLGRADRDMMALPPRTTMARSLVDAAAWAGSDHAAGALIAAGFQQRLVTLQEIDQTVRRLPRLPRRALIMQVARDASGGAHSLPEAEFLRALRRARLPAPQLQVRRRDAGGRSRYLDAYYARWRLHIEIDGGQHLEVRTYWADMRRQNEIWTGGDRILRFPSWAVRHQTFDVITQVRAALRAAGWSP